MGKVEKAQGDLENTIDMTISERLKGWSPSGTEIASSESKARSVCISSLPVAKDGSGVVREPCMLQPNTPPHRHNEQPLDEISSLKRRRLKQQRNSLAVLDVSVSDCGKLKKAFSGPVPLQRIFDKMEMNMIGVVMMLVWQDKPQEIGKYGQNSRSKGFAFHSWGTGPEQQWVRVSAYGRMGEVVCIFLHTLPGGFGYVEFSNLSHNRPLRGVLEGAIAMKVEEGSDMRHMQACSLWKDVPQPALCDNFMNLKDFDDKRKCFLLAQVRAVSSMLQATLQCAERLPVQLLDVHGSVRACTVFPPLCHDTLWQTGCILNIFGATVSMQYASITISSDACVCCDERTDASAFCFDKIYTTTW